MSNPRQSELREKALKGGTRYLPKLREQNKLTARERLDLLLDKGSFIEDGIFANVLADELPADGVVTGLGMIGSRLEVDVHVVTAPVAVTQNIVTCMNKAGIEVVLRSRAQSTADAPGPRAPYSRPGVSSETERQPSSPSS